MKKLSSLFIMFLLLSCNKELCRPVTEKMVIKEELFYPAEHFHVGYFCFDIKEFNIIETDTLYIDRFKKR
jgi:hypothetical protein